MSIDDLRPPSPTVAQTMAVIPCDDGDNAIAVMDHHHATTRDIENWDHTPDVHHKFGGILEATEHDSSHMYNETDSDLRQKFIREITKEMIAEMSGTFVMIQLGTAAVMSSVYKPPGGAGLSDDLISIAIVWVIAVTIAICISTSVSSAHLNPAITLAFVTVRPKSSIGWKKVIPYIIAQFSGAILASLVNFYIYYDAIQRYEMTNGITRSSSNAIPSAVAFGEYYTTTVFRAFFVEAFGTFVLAAVIFALTHPDNDLISKKDGSEVFIPPLIGCTVGALICTLAPITQAGFNPARDFGPRFVAYFAGWTSVAFLPTYSWLVYIFGPIVGAILGAVYVDFVLFRRNDPANVS